MRQFLKYEFKRNYKSFILSYMLVLISFIIMSIFALFVKNISDVNQIMIIIYSNIIFIILGSIGTAIVLFIINLIKSFYISIFSDEGYLTLSFPKTTDSLLLSKIIANLFWIVMLFITFVIGFLILNISITGSLNDLFVFFTDLLSEYNNLIAFPFYIIKGLINYVMIFVLLLLSFTLINLGNLKKAKILLGILIFIGINYILNTCDIFIDLISFGIAIDANNNILFIFGKITSDSYTSNNIVSYLFNIPETIFDIGVTLCGYILTRYLINNKIEIE